MLESLFLVLGNTFVVQSLLTNYFHNLVVVGFVSVVIPTYIFL